MCPLNQPNSLPERQASGTNTRRETRAVGGAQHGYEVDQRMDELWFRLGLPTSRKSKSQESNTHPLQSKDQTRQHPAQLGVRTLGIVKIELATMISSFEE